MDSYTLWRMLQTGCNITDTPRGFPILTTLPHARRQAEPSPICMYKGHLALLQPAIRRKRTTGMRGHFNCSGDSHRARSRKGRPSQPMSGYQGSSCVLPTNYLVSGGRSSEVYDGLADGEVALHRPRQVEELGRDELEDLVHVDVVRRA